MSLDAMISTLRQAGRRYGLRAVAALLAASLIASGHAQTGAERTPAGTVVPNVAVAEFSLGGVDREATSNVVESLVTGICGVAITPDGTIGSPGQTLVATPGSSVAFPYLLTSTANLTADFQLEAVAIAGDVPAPASLTIYHDLNGDGILDPGDVAVSTFSGFAPGATAALILVVELAPGGTAGDLHVDLVGRCFLLGDTDPGAVDEGNVARVNVVFGGVRDLAKNAAPAPGSAVAPGEALSYTVAFTVNELPLTDVLLSDPLDAWLDPPSAVTLSLDGLPLPGVAVYDAATHTVSAALASLAPASEVALTIATTVRVDAPGGAVLRNQAELTFAGGGDVTETVEHVVFGTCSLTIEPDGSLAAPGQSTIAYAGDTAILSYTLINTGNTAADFVLTPVVVGGDSAANGLRVVHDLDGDGEPGALEPVVTVLSGVPAGASVALLLLVDLAYDPTAGGVLFVDLVGACAGDPTVRDEGNVALVTVLPGGISALSKSAEPPSGTAVYPGAPLRYRLSLEAGPLPLTDVVVRDLLDPLLEAPSAVTEGIITDQESGLSAVATVELVGGALVWRLATVPAGMTVELAYQTAVRSDAPTGVVVSNRATVISASNPERSSNTTLHPVEALALRLVKSSEPPVVRSGERLSYLLVASNPSETVTLPETLLSDSLPEGVRYVGGSSRMTLADGGELALEPVIDGSVLAWSLPPMAPGEEISVRFEVLVLPMGSGDTTLVNTAELRALGPGGEVLVVTSDSVATRLVSGVFGESSALIGTAFVDNDSDGLYDREVDVPVGGLRLYLADGRTTVTDEQGRYTFPDLTPGVVVLKLDATTLPPRWLDRTPAEASEGLWRLDLRPGTVTRQDIPFAAPDAFLRVSQRLSLRAGPLSLAKEAVGEEDGAVVVRLEIVASEAVRGLVVEETLPASASLLEPLARLDTAAGSAASGPTGHLTGDVLSYHVGDLAAGETVVLSYTIATALHASALPLTPPRLHWEWRP